MNSHIPKALGALAVAVITATGGMAWTASADNRAQEERIAANAEAVRDLRTHQREVLSELSENNKNLAVIAERLRVIEKELSRE